MDTSIPGLTIPDKDVCEYHVYLKEPSAARVSVIQEKAVSIHSPWTKEYIWQDEVFALSVNAGQYLHIACDDSIDVADHTLHGKTHFGDCIEDEWFIVWNLTELSRQCQDIYVQITDTDGSFLLIESAMHLPRWLDPDTAENRAWIRNGQFIIIPPSPSDVLNKRCPALTIDQALAHLRADKEVLRTPAIEADAFARIKRYPELSRRELHRVSCRLPRVLATMLHHGPGLISPLTLACVQRDDLQTADFKERPSAVTGEEVQDLVDATVRFTRTLYAHIIGIRFAVPDWYPQVTSSDKDVKASHEMGCKIVAGLAGCHDTRVTKAMESARTRLATDEEIASWREVPDSDAFMHVDFHELENVLAGDKNNSKSSQYDESDETIKKMVEQMQKFMNTDATFEGAEFSGEDEDEDDDQNDYDEDDVDDFRGYDDEDDVEDGFGDEDMDFMNFLRSSVTGTSALDALQKSTATRPSTQDKRDDKSDNDDTDDESVGDLNEYMAAMDAELSGHGLSHRDLAQDDSNSVKTNSEKGKSKGKGKDKSLKIDSDDEDLQIDFNMAKNMLESMQSMGGMQGPAAGLLGRMGISLPRDDHDDSDELQEPVD